MDHLVKELSTEITIEEMLKEVDFVPRVVELKHETPTVDRILNNWTTQWENTADACIKRAEELELAATELRERAEYLRRSMALSNDIKEVIDFEINSRNRANSLALVNPRSEE